MTTVKTPGIDVSTWQDASSTPTVFIDFNKTVALGSKFVFIKASQGLYVDQDFKINWQLSRQAGLLRGAYHWLNWTVDPKDQAKFFIATVRDAGGDNELPLVCDFEDVLTSKLTKQDIQARLLVFLTEIQAITDRVPMIYTSLGFWNVWGSSDSRWLEYDLWLAQYTTASLPTVPKPWPVWKFWQWTAKGDGLAHGMESKGLDQDWFFGSYADLRDYAKLTNPPITQLTLKELSAMHTGITHHP